MGKDEESVGGASTQHKKGGDQSASLFKKQKTVMDDSDELQRSLLE
jgi:hypothetical protein